MHHRDILHFFGFFRSSIHWIILLRHPIDIIVKYATWSREQFGYPTTPASRTRYKTVTHHTKFTSKFTAPHGRLTTSGCIYTTCVWQKKQTGNSMDKNHIIYIPCIRSLNLLFYYLANKRRLHIRSQSLKIATLIWKKEKLKLPTTVITKKLYKIPKYIFINYPTVPLKYISIYNYNNP